MDAEINLYILVGSILEMTGLYNINITIRPKYCVGVGKASLVVIVTSFLTAFLDYINITSYQSFLIIVCYIALIKVFAKKNLLILIIDTVISYGILFILELPVVYLTRILKLQWQWISYFILGLLVLITVWCKRNTTIEYFCSKYYRSDNKVIYIAVNFFLLCCMLVNLYNLHDLVFKDNYLELILIILGYIIISILYFISTYKRSKEQEKIKIITEHQKYLNFITEELNHRQHEYKNEINVILGIAEQKNGNASLDEIILYAEQIFKNKLDENKMTIVSENTIVAALIYRFYRRAEKEKIDFSYYIEKPFPSYAISEYELIELLSNLLNNAFEAVRFLDNRLVLIKVEQGQILIVNAVGEDFRQDHIITFGTGVTTKGNGHGYGLRNVFRIINKYNMKTEIYLEGGNLHFLLLFI